jgi:hypothetical protein
VDVSAKVVIYEAFIEGRREAPKRLARSVHDPYFEPKYEEFRPRTIWSCGALFRIGQVGYSLARLAPLACDSGSATGVFQL